MADAIVVGTDGSDTATRALEQAARYAKALGGELHIVSAYEPMHAKVSAPGAAAVEGQSVPADAKVRTVVDEAAARVRVEGLEATTHTLTGDPADALLEVADKLDASLIVVGSRGMHGVKRVLGSVPNKVSHGARCSVLIVSTDR
ncbi:MAG TPA: universal stress protein [Solirubrobacteraceae bacterium]|jgi:nucleotide-binding universal stress UspA family protein|nr:universal stress protein [Solirubrobacteraceae bacterium]